MLGWVFVAGMFTWRDIYGKNDITLHTSERSAVSPLQVAGVWSQCWHSVHVGKVCHLDPRAASRFYTAIRLELVYKSWWGQEFRSSPAPLDNC